MQKPAARPDELALPVNSLAALRNALEGQVGADIAADALRHSGHAAGDALIARLAQNGDPDANNHEQLRGVTGDTFWRRLSQLFATRGWGTLTHDTPHPGIGSLESTNWVEAVPGSATRPSCYFTTGMLANLLGHAAGGDVAVLEAECRSRGDAHCRFLFGSPAALDALYTKLRSGEDVQESIAALT